MDGKLQALGLEVDAGMDLLKGFVTSESESDLRPIWMGVASHFVLGFCLWFLLYVNAKYA